MIWYNNTLCIFQDQDRLPSSFLAELPTPDPTERIVLLFFLNKFWRIQPIWPYSISSSLIG